ncbi:SMP-30/gluconolactonase/LRE family protein [Simiduia curdlanivorans]|uniref:SMP-30/gluconolactonase/LRE family protein n=1 Tax=Simiduia curdlanivorans TaxID=1492769 RepID=A0ABV8V510_9GAMM|nr:SMP-30/gluconolactonase/LRE family protein [Simiduia curdlanivorans]MDN3638151.1 SMP-30/gluconolactonase/LRE family protein [Simiduia curdlanivorans]
MDEVTCIWDAQATLGEGPLWVAAESSLYWLDIKQSCVHRLNTQTEARQSWLVPEQVTSIAKRKSGAFVATIRDGFVALSLGDRHSIAALHLVEANSPDNRFNDGKVDVNGRYWAGSMDDKEQRSTGALYCLDLNGAARSMDAGYCISNGPTFSPDGKRLYHTSTTERIIYQFDLDAAGELSNKRVFYRVPDLDGYPDGMTVDAEGCIWLCHFFGGKITRLSPAGEALRTIALPVSNITSCTFGGAQLDKLYITTARWGLSEQQLQSQPLAGGLFVCRPGVKGLASNEYLG